MLSHYFLVSYNSITMNHNPYLIQPAMIVERKQEPPNTVTFRLQLTDPAHQGTFRFDAGQFNMIYVFDVREVPIFIVSDPDEPGFLDHTAERNLSQWGNVGGEIGCHCHRPCMGNRTGTLER